MTTESKGGYSNKGDDEEGSKASKVLIKFQGQRINFHSIDRIEPTDEYDANDKVMKYGFIVRCLTYPSEVKFMYGSAELRDIRMEQFDTKMETCRTTII